MFSSLTVILFAFLRTNPGIIYLFLFVGLLIEGEAVLFITAFIAHQSRVHPGLLITLAYTSAVIGDYLWYSFGKTLAQKNNFMASWAKRAVKPINALIPRHPTQALFLTKFMYGIHRAVLVKVGMEKMPTGYFLKRDILAAMVWVTVVGFLAFWFNSSLQIVSHYLRYTEVVFLIGLFVFFALGHVSAMLVSREITSHDLQ
jgi:membrane protein DedA with SNARE-associated domain